MRSRLRGLTTRGRAFAAAGLTAVIAGMGLDQPVLLRAGLLVLGLPLLAASLVGRTGYRLKMSREVEPATVSAGQPASVRLTLANSAAPPRGVLMVEDLVPYALGSRPRFVLSGVGRDWRRTVSYPVRSESRGRYVIGPVAVRATDPFGLVEYARSFRSTSTLTVTPRVVPLKPIPIGGAWTGSGDNRPRAFATGSAEDVTVREYRRGDDLRRVHWRSSARVGELMVRREEQPWQSRATIFLDNRSGSHRGSGLGSTFEVAVEAAASIGAHLVHRGFLVRLVTATGEATGPQWHVRDEEANHRSLMDALAVVGLVERGQLESGWLVESARSGVVISVLGRSTGADSRVLRRMAAHATSALAIALNVDAWVAGPAFRQSPPTAAAGLAALGWRAVDLSPGDRLPLVWEQLGLGQHLSAPAGSAAR